MSDYVVKEWSDAGLTCKVYYDDSPLNPRTDWDNLCKLVLPDNRTLDSELDLGLEWEDEKEDEERLMKNDVYMYSGLYRYEHSGVAYSTGPFGDPWDSGQVGYIVAMRKDVEKEWGKDKADTKEVRDLVWQNMQGEVEALSQWANGEVYGFVITDDDTDEEIDSCWGFFGDDGLEEIKAEFDGYVEDRKREEREAFEAENSLFIASGINLATLETA